MRTGSSKGGQPRRPGGPSAAGTMARGLRTSKILLSSTKNKLPFAARSTMVLVLGRACEGI